MNKIYTLALLIFTTNSFAQNITFVDDSLESCILADTLININKDSYIDSLEAVNTATIRCSNSVESISDLSQFSNLRSLNLTVSNIDSLNFEGNKCLQILSLIDSSSETQHKLSYLNLQNNDSLLGLVVQNSALESLKIENLEFLELLIINKSNLSDTFRILNNPLLRKLSITNSQLDGLFVSSESAQKITDITLALNKFKLIDFNDYPSLLRINCSNNDLTELLIDKAEKLERMNCGINKLESIDVTQNISLKFLECDSNLLTKVDLSSNTSLKELNISKNKLEQLNLKNGNNKFLRLNSTRNPNLPCITVDDPEFSKLNWTLSTDAGIQFSGNCLLGIDDVQTINPVIYPNPNNGTFHIKNLKVGSIVQVFNVNGMYQYSSSFYDSIFTINNLSQGLYFVKILNQNEVFTYKVIVAK